MRKLFLSFTSLTFAVKDDRITEGDLATGLFYFGCARELLFDEVGSKDPGAVHFDNLGGQRISADSPIAKAIAKIQQAIIAAERDGRVLWRERWTQNSFEELEALLSRNGIGPLPPRTADEWDYSYAGAKDLLARSSLPLEGFIGGGNTNSIGF